MPITMTELDSVRDTIAKVGAHWVADETPISKLTPEARSGLLLRSPLTRKEVPKTAFAAPRPLLSAVFDWRDAGGKNYVTPVKSQVGPTCVAFANTAALESCILREGCELGTDDIDLSERFLVACNPGDPEFLQSTGLPPEDCYTFAAASGPTAGWQDQTFKVINHDYYQHIAIEDFKALVAHAGPLVTGMNVPDDFFSYKSGVYTATSKSIQGFHEVLAIGYDDNNKCFICKNSWGTGWGEDGFFRISYTHFADKFVEFGVLTDAYSGVVPPRRRMMSVPIALMTMDNHVLTIVNGGGLGGPNSGPGAVAIHTDAVEAGPWETFRLEWVDSTYFALKTVNGNYVTAVNGGGVGGANDASSPVHSDATWVGPWEQLTLNYNSVTGTATIQVPNGRYLTAVNGGGYGGPNKVPIHTDARAIGPWEKFRAMIAH